MLKNIRSSFRRIPETKSTGQNLPLRPSNIYQMLPLFLCRDAQHTRVITDHSGLKARAEAPLKRWKLAQQTPQYLPPVSSLLVCTGQSNPSKRKRQLRLEGMVPQTLLSEHMPLHEPIAMWEINVGLSEYGARTPSLLMELQ